MESKQALWRYFEKKREDARWEYRAKIENWIYKELMPEKREKIEREVIEEIIIRTIWNFLDVFGPTKEKGVVWLFDLYKKELGFGRSHNAFGSGYDAEIEKGDKEIRVEFEKTTGDFLDHGHDPKNVDLVICWRKTAQIPVPVLELSKELPKLILKHPIGCAEVEKAPAPKRSPSSTGEEAEVTVVS